jgi:integrase
MTDSASKTPSRPKGVHVKNGRYYRIVRNRWIGLTRVDEGITALRRAMRDTPTTTSPKTVLELLGCYLPQAELAPRTRQEYERIADTRLAHHFGAMPITAVTAAHVAMYLEKRKRDGHGHMGNRERAVLSSAYEFAMRQGWANGNPCQGVRRNKERPRSRYVTDAEFLEAFEAAPQPLQDVLALALLTGARQGELRALLREDLKEDGIYVRETKTQKVRVVGWTEALRYFVTRALARQEQIASRPADPRLHRRARRVSDTVLTNRFGEAWTMAGLQTAWKRLCADWHFHDIRAKAASDAGGNILGHGAGMLSVYVRHQRVSGLR